jgi:hypothetical protein
MALGTMQDRDSIKREAEEAEAELAAIKAAKDKEESDKLAQVNELPVGSATIEDIFANADPATDDPGSGIEVKTDDLLGGKKDGENPPTDSAAMLALQAENARLQAELSKLQTRFESTFGNFNKQGMAELTKKVKDLEAKLAIATAAPKTADVAIPDREEMVKDLGEPATKIIEFLQSKVGSLETALQDVTGKVNSTGERAVQLEAATANIATQNYYSSLDTLCPQWRKVNGDDKNPQNPKVTAFLNSIIPGTEFTYDDMLKEHHSKGNAALVAKIFKLAEEAAGLNAAATGKEKDELIPEPDKTGRGTALPKTTTKDKRIYTRAEIDRFDNLKKNGKLNATPDQIAAVESDIQDAILEGRIRG